MFITVELENIGPYTEKVLFDFKVNKKAKKNMESTITLPDGTIISRIAGVIAGNACGKSTLIDALTSIGAFIDLPFKKNQMSSLEDFAKKHESSAAREAYEQYYNFMQTLIPLIPVNKSKPDNIGSIKLEMYIDSNDSYEGFYQYIIQYGSDIEENGILMEQLSFKKKYSVSYRTIFRTRKGTKESEIGIKLKSKQSWLVELDSAGMNTSSFEERMKYYETFYNRYINESSIMRFDYQAEEDEIAETVEKEKELFVKALKTVDSSILDIHVDIDAEDKKVFIVYDGYQLRYDYLSTATKKVCDFLYNLVITSKKNGVLLSDEFDSSLNRGVIKTLIGLYYDSNIKRTGQLIFTAITPEIFDQMRRDQTFILTKENGIVRLTRFDSFINPESNQLARNDFSFTKAYKNNIIKNYPLHNLVDEFIDYMEERV